MKNTKPTPPSPQPLFSLPSLLTTYLSSTLFTSSFDLESLQPLESQPLNTSAFSLQLYPRDAFFNSLHKDYKSLTLTRLGRDSARVNSLHTKLQLALQGIKRGDLEPMHAEIQPHDLSTPIVPGVSPGSGEYFSRIGVRTPAKSFYMVLDTGSDVNWHQCNPCSDCYQQSDPVFNPAGSSNYSQLSGSINKITLGCGHDNEGLGEDSEEEGGGWEARLDLAWENMGGKGL